MRSSPSRPSSRSTLLGAVNAGVSLPEQRLIRRAWPCLAFEVAYPPSFSRRISLARRGSAAPSDFFMSRPMKKPSSRVSPAR